MSNGGSTGGLSGLRALEMGQLIAGPFCGQLMADHGAEVIKIEPPEGDAMRVAPPVRDGRSAYFGHLNTGKRSVVLDLKAPAALQAARTLAQRADVLVENFRPGVMKRLGLDFATLRADNKISLPEVISRVGGLSEYANPKEVVVIKNVNGNKNFYHVNMEDVNFFSSPNFMLGPDDIVYVKSDSKKLSQQDRLVRQQRNLTYTLSGISLFILILDRITRK